MQPDLARIAFVSRRFNELKGLPTVVAGALLLSVMLLFSRVGGRPDVAFGGGLVMAVMTATNLFDLKYRAAFGRSVSESPLAVTSMLATSLPMALMCGGVWDRVAAIAHVGGPSGGAVAVGCASLVVLARDFRWRPHYAVPLAGAIFGIAITATSSESGRDPQRAAAFLVAYTVVALGVMAAGLLDHRLLTSVLSNRTPRRPSTAPRPHSSRWLNSALFATVSFGLAVVLPEGYAAIALVTPLLVALMLTMTLETPPPLRTAILRVPEVAEADTEDQDADATLPSVSGLMPLIVLATAAAADIGRPASPPVFVEGAFAACSLWIAVTTPHRRHYLVGVAASGVAFIVGAGMQPLWALTVFLSAAAAAVAFVLFTERKTGHHGQLRHADTI